MISSSILEDAEQESLRVIGKAAEKGIPLRLLGGIAIKMRCISAKHRALLGIMPTSTWLALRNNV